MDNNLFFTLADEICILSEANRDRDKNLVSFSLLLCVDIGGIIHAFYFKEVWYVIFTYVFFSSISWRTWTQNWNSHIYGMKLCNQTSDPKECVIFLHLLYFRPLLHSQENHYEFLLVTIQEPLIRPFQKTPYFSQGDNFCIFDGCPKFGNFKILYFSQNLKISKLWTLTNYRFD